MNRSIWASISTKKRRSPVERRLSLPCYSGGMSYRLHGPDGPGGKGPGRSPAEHPNLYRRRRLSQGVPPYADYVITQVATGLFGVREETIQRVPGVEFKYAQGAKPGLGGPPAGRQGHARGCRHARDRGGQLAVLALSLPQRLFGGRPQEACRLDQASQPQAWFGEGLHAHGCGHGGRGQLLCRGPYRPYRRQLRRHRRGPGHRQEEHRHADRVRHPQGAPVPGRTRESVRTKSA
jgi:hypothetical protein